MLLTWTPLISLIWIASSYSGGLLLFCAEREFWSEGEGEKGLVGSFKNFCPARVMCVWERVCVKWNPLTLSLSNLLDLLMWVVQKLKSLLNLSWNGFLVAKWLRKKPHPLININLLLTCHYIDTMGKFKTRMQIIIHNSRSSFADWIVSRHVVGWMQPWPPCMTSMIRLPWDPWLMVVPRVKKNKRNITFFSEQGNGMVGGRERELLSTLIVVIRFQGSISYHTPTHHCLLWMLPWHADKTKNISRVHNCKYPAVTRALHRMGVRLAMAQRVSW